MYLNQSICQRSTFLKTEKIHKGKSKKKRETKGYYNTEQNNKTDLTERGGLFHIPTLKHCNCLDKHVLNQHKCSIETVTVRWGRKGTLFEHGVCVVVMEKSKIVAPQQDKKG